jgi:uncharacterized repeat protein (TIGR03803 family)
VVFAINTDGSGYRVLKEFTGADGAWTGVGLALSGSVLYGTTRYGPINSGGTVFKINTDGTGFTILKTFTSNDAAGDAYSGVVLAGNKLYGTLTGRYTGNGAVYRLNTDGSGYQVLKTFSGGQDGAWPYGGLVISGGTLYGTTQIGGTSSNGVIFALSLGVPIAANITAATLQYQPLNLAVAKVLALASDPNGGSMSISGVSAASTNGGSVVLGPNQITYTPLSGYVGADRFSYTLSDAEGASASAYVFLQVRATNQISGNMLPLSTISGGYLVSFAGIPGRTYSVQRASAVTGPWATIAAATAGLDGIAAIQDTNSPPGTAFYRTTYP